MRSIVQPLGAVQFPEHTGERVYMRPFFMASGLPEDLQRWQPTVDSMLSKVDTDQPIYLMVDQGYVTPGKTHRRPGLHIDGYWNPGIQAHGGGGPRHHTEPEPKRAPGHGTRPSHITKFAGYNTHVTKSGLYVLEKDWPVEGIILASDVAACRAKTGDWDGDIGEGGDVTHLDLSHMPDIYFESHQAYAGNVTMIHESLPINAACKRTVVRLNVPGWSPKE